MKRLNGILNNTISVLSRFSYIEGSHTDLYVQRLLKMYGHPRQNILEKQSDNETTALYTIAHIVTGEDIAKPKIVAPPVKS